MHSSGNGDRQESRRYDGNAETQMRGLYSHELN